MIAILLPGAHATTAAQQEIVLHTFNPGAREGINPEANVIFDSAGNLFGTTYEGGTIGCFGGSINCGTVFELSPRSDGTWAEKTIHNFNGNDGAASTAGLIVDASGNLYGTTAYGGTDYYGVVFELLPTKNGGWVEKVLHQFEVNGVDGLTPYGSLVFDRAGNLYGTTSVGGAYDGGVVFELSPTPGGNWNETVIHNFASDSTDGANPFDALIIDAAGNLYGTTPGGGTYGYGTVFELSPMAGGSWNETILHNFNFNRVDGVQTYAGLTFDNHGNLYGTTPGGGTNEHGTVFELIPTGGGQWTENILHNFNGDKKSGDGTEANTSVTIDSAGNIFGTTLSGGAYGHGTVFELSPAAGGVWTETILVNFSGDNGGQPAGAVIMDATGNLYGTTIRGGIGQLHGDGVVFEIQR